MCQWCVNEGLLSQETFDSIESFLDKWPDAAYGPAHIVLDDCNVLNGHIEFALAKLDEYYAPHYTSEHTGEELEATRRFLQYLLITPEEER